MTRCTADGIDLCNYPKSGYDWCLVQEFGAELTRAMTNQPSHGCGAQGASLLRPIAIAHVD